MTAYPTAWINLAAEAAHHALDAVDDGWHLLCLDNPDNLSCGKGHTARAMLAEDVMPAVLDALRRAGALNVEAL
ncbi:MAG TPA: hypothetical protein VI172_08260 [Candidatus Dormibacteraeota bacterium]|jgi:hypothetical protein